ncbi:hypothetical protein RhiirA4_432006 [Rhizophagus irregularis]|uniref:Uncharacterized protein n=1 Tax=Rhizophagus irregularis TaxID=588596 RepID=A0A2I1HS76_9GLOM|nr:hypothetical protein RhiirA4_432006 [Rhizophagus irregularis]
MRSRSFIEGCLKRNHNRLVQYLEEGGSVSVEKVVVEEVHKVLVVKEFFGRSFHVQVVISLKKFKILEDSEEENNSNIEKEEYVDKNENKEYIDNDYDEEYDNNGEEIDNVKCTNLSKS